MADPSHRGTPAEASSLMARRWLPVVAFSVLAVALVAAPLIALVADERASVQRSMLRQQSTPVTVAAHDLERTLLQLIREAGRLDLEEDPDGLERLSTGAAAVDEAVQQLTDAARDTMFQESASVANARARAVALNVREGLGQLLEGEEEQGAETLARSSAGLLDDFVSSAEALSAEAEGDLESRPASIERIERISLIAQITAAALGAAGLIVVVWLARSRETLLGQVERQQDRFISLVESIGLGVYEINLHGEITYMNPVGARLLGYEPGELDGCPAYQMLHQTRGDGTPIAPSESWAHANWGPRRPFTGEDALTRKDGALLPVDVVSRPIGSRRRRTGAVVAFRDIATQLKQRQMQEDFVALASHELRNPLTSVQGFALMLDRRAQQDPQAFDPQAREAISTIRDSAERLSSTLKLFSQLAAIEAGQFEPEAVPVDLVPLAQDEVAALRLRHPHLNVTDVVASGPVVVNTDEERVVEILGNLLENAARHGGADVVIQVTADVEGDTACLRVSDNGPGVPPELRARAFERERTRGETGGMGLGLYISREIAVHLGGDLRLEGDTGADFVLALPLNRREAPGS